MSQVYEVTSTYYVDGKEQTAKFCVLGMNEFQAYNNADAYLFKNKGVAREGGYPWHNITAKPDTDPDTQKIKEELLQPFAGSQ